MSTPLFVVVLVGIILAVQVIIWIPIVVWLRRRSRRLVAELEREPGMVRPPERAVYRGATAPGFSSVRGNGVIALTADRLLFLPYAGSRIAITRSDVVGAHEAKVFTGSVTGGRMHLVVETRHGDVGFYVADNAAWLTALR